MSGVQWNTITAAGNAAANSVASALLPKKNASLQAADSTSGTTGTSTSSTASTASTGDITADDFLTLLVSELKNQDPTQPTDPNQYITQLAQVNSLQQLISINSGISTLDSAVPTPTTSGTAPVSGTTGG